MLSEILIMTLIRFSYFLEYQTPKRNMNCELCVVHIVCYNTTEMILERAMDLLMTH